MVVNYIMASIVILSDYFGCKSNLPSLYHIGPGLGGTIFPELIRQSNF